MQRILLKQADGHPTVAFRLNIDEKHCEDIPNGTVLQMLGREGGFVKVMRGTRCGYVKARNAKLIVSKPAQPVPAKPVPAPVSSPKPVLKEVMTEAATVCNFSFNGTPYTIDLSKESIDPQLSAHDWVMENVANSGLRRSCGVGRCGSCVCTLTFTDQTENRTTHRAFNSCLRPILSCHGMSITSSLGIGNTKTPNPIQAALAQNSGSQCGFCSVGMVMHLYSRLADAGGEALTTAELDKMIDSNYCRCTGYRPILDTYKSFASDAKQLAAKEDPDAVRRAAVFNAVPLPKPEAPVLNIEAPKVPVVKKRVAGSTDGGTQWIQVTTEAQLTSTLKTLQTSNPDDIFLVAGHTSKGVYTEREPDVMVDISGVSTMQNCVLSSSGVEIGSGCTMTDTITFLENVVSSAQADKTIFFKRIAEHAKMSPGSNIRNMGTVGGNVMMAYENQHQGTFPTDWPMLLMAAGATVTFVDTVSDVTTTIPIENFFLVVSMKFKYIKGFSIPYSVPGDMFFSYRTGIRAVYTEAYVMAAMKVNITNKVVAPTDVRVVYNGISSKPVRMIAIETGLSGATVTNQNTFQSLCDTLYTGLPSVIDDYRKSLCLSFFYKFFLGMQPSLPISLKLAKNPWIVKGTTGGTQVFQPSSSKAPVGLPIPKIDGLKQCTGEAEYIQNIAPPKGTLHGCPLLSTAVGDFTLDVSKVTEMGYKGIILAKDVPNNGASLIMDKTSTYIGANLAVVLADDHESAVKAARQVLVTYTNVKTPILTIDEAIQAGSLHPNPPAPVVQGDVSKGFTASDFVVEDTWDLSSQYHFHLETHSALAVPMPEDGGFVVHSATQMPTFVAEGVCTTLGNLPKSKVTVKNKRCGGGYGGKLANSIIPAQLAAVCSNTKNMPVSIIYEQKDNMASVGLRTPCKLTSKIGFNKDGTIVAVQLTPYIDAGITNGSGFSGKAFLGSFDNCYNIPNWNVSVQFAKTNLPANTSMRAPGWLPGIYNAERVITTVARHLNMEAPVVRQNNFYKKGDTTPYGLTLKNWDIDSLWERTREASSYTNRLQSVQNFNKYNRWVKKGLALVPSKFAVGYASSQAGSTKEFDAKLTVHNDGTMTVMCGGTEIGQGLTTKVVQTIAFNLGVDMSIITVAEQNTQIIGSTGASDVTGGSIGSEMTCRAAYNCCAAVNTALAPVRKLLPTATWTQLVAKAYELGIALTFQKMDQGVPGPSDPTGHVYNTYGCVALECTLDVLTGQVDFDRADITYDLGTSSNPAIDIGQIEGAFVIGMGYAMTEKISYDTKGKMAWADYLLPTPWEIPTIMNVTLATEVSNPFTVNGGKAVGEPPITCTYAAIEAVEQATNAAAADAGKSPSPSKSVPFMLQERQAAGYPDYKSFTLV
eukprot:TRINITY_DN6820_c0_g4_i1.p1 TRINITY_DN6820_c0_g4~~TRINITY_DN6820_c0_g4_i1.p1  ORF type:complete len:1378 (+),score=357.48 TRINITY_DN6820_c0_g4_i1:56-4189(+)